MSHPIILGCGFEPDSETFYIFIMIHFTKHTHNIDVTIPDEKIKKILKIIAKDKIVDMWNDKTSEFSINNKSDMKDHVLNYISNKLDIYVDKTKKALYPSDISSNITKIFKYATDKIYMEYSDGYYEIVDDINENIFKFKNTEKIMDAFKSIYHSKENEIF